jgi:hypothetical protein
MKLILKRVGPDRRQFHTVGEPVSTSRNLAPDMRPCGLHTEDGEPLPRQMSAVLSSDHSGPTLTVVFIVDGDSIAVEGDA